jgi:Flp pilus assembly protein TadG
VTTSPNRPRRRWSERGAAAVETAIVLPVLLFVVFGIIDFGRMLNTQLKLTEAAREGARAAVMHSDPDARVQGVVCQYPVGDSRCTAANTGVTTTVDNTQAAGGTVCTGTNCDPCPYYPSTTSTTNADDAVIYANQDFTFITPLGQLAAMLHVVNPTGSGTKRLTGKGVMPCVG